MLSSCFATVLPEIFVSRPHKVIFPCSSVKGDHNDWHKGSPNLFLFCLLDLGKKDENFYLSGSFSLCLGGGWVDGLGRKTEGLESLLHVLQAGFFGFHGGTCSLLQQSTHWGCSSPCSLHNVLQCSQPRLLFLQKECNKLLSCAQSKVHFCQSLCFLVLPRLSVALIRNSLQQRRGHRKTVVDWFSRDLQ